jgi:hypothetical protein
MSIVVIFSTHHGSTIHESTNCNDSKCIYCNADGQSGIFTVPCRAEPGRAGPGRGVLVATQSCGKHLSAALPW